MTFRCSDAFVTLAVADIETLVKFYAQLLNQQPKPCIPNVYAEFQLPELRLGIFKPKENHRVEFENSTPSGMSLCLEVEDLEKAITLTGFLRIAHLTNLGHPPPGKIMLMTQREIA